MAAPLAMYAYIRTGEDCTKKTPNIEKGHSNGVELLWRAALQHARGRTQLVLTERQQDGPTLEILSNSSLSEITVAVAAPKPIKQHSINSNF